MISYDSVEGVGRRVSGDGGQRTNSELKEPYAWHCVDAQTYLLDNKCNNKDRSKIIGRSVWLPGLLTSILLLLQPRLHTAPSSFKIQIFKLDIPGPFSRSQSYGFRRLCVFSTP